MVTFSISQPSAFYFRLMQVKNHSTSYPYLLSSQGVKSKESRGFSAYGGPLSIFVCPLEGDGYLRHTCFIFQFFLPQEIS
jgi:hypothetical protein